jgi:hypothetical protein
MVVEPLAVKFPLEIIVGIQERGWLTEELILE